MNRKILDLELKKLKIDSSKIALHPPYPSHECLCIEQKQDTWEVYFMERGKKWDTTKYTSESEACKAFLKQAHIL